MIFRGILFQKKEESKGTHFISVTTLLTFSVTRLFLTKTIATTTTPTAATAITNIIELAGP